MATIQPAPRVRAQKPERVRRPAWAPYITAEKKCTRDSPRGLAERTPATDYLAADARRTAAWSPERRARRERLLSVTCTYYGVTPERLRGRDRDRPVVEARIALFVLLMELVGMSLIGAAHFLGRDHTTMLHHRDAYREGRQAYDMGDTFPDALADLRRAVSPPG